MFQALTVFNGFQPRHTRILISAPPHFPFGGLENPIPNPGIRRLLTVKTNSNITSSAQNEDTQGMRRGNFDWNGRKRKRQWSQLVVGLHRCANLEVGYGSGFYEFAFKTVLEFTLTYLRSPRVRTISIHFPSVL